MAEMADCSGVPEYFATHVKIEDAGAGCIRIYGCTLRYGLLIPAYSVVFPIESVLKASLAVKETAQRVLESRVH